MALWILPLSESVSCSTRVEPHEKISTLGPVVERCASRTPKRFRLRCRELFWKVLFNRILQHSQRSRLFGSDHVDEMRPIVAPLSSVILVASTRFAVVFVTHRYTIGGAATQSIASPLGLLGLGLTFPISSNNGQRARNHRVPAPGLASAKAWKIS